MFAGNSSAMGCYASIDFECSIQDRTSAKNANQFLNFSYESYRALAYDVESNRVLNSSDPAANTSYLKFLEKYGL